MCLTLSYSLTYYESLISPALTGDTTLIVVGSLLPYYLFVPSNVNVNKLPKFKLVVAINQIKFQAITCINSVMVLSSHSITVKCRDHLICTMHVFMADLMCKFLCQNSSILSIRQATFFRTGTNSKIFRVQPVTFVMIVSTNFLPIILGIFKGATTKSLIPTSVPFPGIQTISSFTFPNHVSWWWIVICINYMSAGFLQVLYMSISQDHHAHWDAVLRVYLVFVYMLVSICFSVFHKFQSTSVCEYFNKMQLFDNRHVRPWVQNRLKSFESKLIAIFVLSFEKSLRAMNALFPIIATILPQLPWNPFSSLYNLFSPWFPTVWYFQYVLRLLVCFVNCFFYWITMDAIIMCYTVNFTIGIYAIKCSIFVFRFCQ